MVLHALTLSAYWILWTSEHMKKWVFPLCQVRKYKIRRLMLRLRCREAPGALSYFENHYSSESKQSLKKPGSKVSFLRQSSDSPTFLTAPTTGEPCSWQTCSSAFHCAEQIQSKVQQRLAVHGSRQNRAKPASERGPPALARLLGKFIQEFRPPAFHG